METEEILSIPSEDELPFRSLDLNLEVSHVETCKAGDEGVVIPVLDLANTDPPVCEKDSDDEYLRDFQLIEDVGHAQEADENASNVEDACETNTAVWANCTLETSQWNFLIASSFSQYKQHHEGLQYPWEQGVFADIFGDGQQLAMPVCSGLAEQRVLDADAFGHESSAADTKELPVDAKFVGVVSSTRDLDYFEEKNQKHELACAQWLELLSISWKAFGVGKVVSEALHDDASGNSATEILKAIFGIKSPSTVLKRASAFRQFVRWFDTSGYGVSTMADPFPIKESAVWEYFMYLRSKRKLAQSGYTIPASFLETVRFAKFTVDLQGADDVLGSRRLLGFAAIEKKLKGPTRQAPGLELEHVRRLHQILMSGANDIDRLGAGCFLICVYGRARWSDVRYIDHIVSEPGRHGSLTLYTTEHKTASVGARREQYLPIAVPWEGVTSDPWLETFLELYNKLGLKTDCKPHGPLLPAPKANGTFCSRPLSTAEAAKWLRALLSGTTDSHIYRSHSLKATVLIWCARAGFDKETRAVLGHHCSATSGSEVVYSRHLQTRALRKLSMLLRRLRVGLGFEDENMREFGIAGTPAVATPGGLFTPGLSKPALPLPEPVVAPAGDKQALEDSLDTMNELEDLQSVKQEYEDLDGAAEAAGELTLFSEELMKAGVVQLDSSSGSSSDESSTSDSSEQELENGSIIKDFPEYSETVPDGCDFHRHVKSCIVHCCSKGSLVTNCKLKISDKYGKLDRVFRVKFPKCLKCFPKNHNRLRSIGELTSAVDGAVKRAKVQGP